MIGLLVVQALRVAGCSRVLVADIDSSRLKLAQDVGATAVLSADAGLIAQVLQLSGGRSRPGG